MTNAGYEIERTESYAKDPTMGYGVAFGKRISNNEDSYVTWEYKVDDIGVYSFFWGHYFSDRNAALSDYYQRLADCYGRHAKEG